MEAESTGLYEFELTVNAYVFSQDENRNINTPLDLSDNQWLVYDNELKTFPCIVQC